MKPAVTLSILLIVLSVQIKSQNHLPQVVSGKIERIENFRSDYITARNIDVWLPDGYSGSTNYAVLYMHDGQMLYDPEQSWNRQAWDIDDVATKLLSENKVKDFIVVGIWNGGETRHHDYFPQQPFEQMTRAEKDSVAAQLQRAGMGSEEFQPRSDKYLQFIVEELKPLIDKSYSVKSDPKNTFIAGSSMGGLISLYAICEYPEIFGGTACMSTHWIGTLTGENNPVPESFIKYLNKNLPDPENHKIYFDSGDQTLDALYPEIQMRVDSLMRSKGYSDGNWVTEYFPGDDHSEKSWNRRLHLPLLFLLGK